MAQTRVRKPKVAQEPPPPLVLRLSPVVELTDAQLFELCAINDVLRIERTAEGDLVIMPPSFLETERENFDLNGQLYVWAREDGTGVCFGSNAGYILPNRAMRAPDASWMLRSRWEALAEVERTGGFGHTWPDFVVELRSSSDRLSVVQAKMQEYMRNGVRLGWLVDPFQRRVHVYRPDAPVDVLEGPRTVSGDPVLPGFILDLAPIWGE